MLSCLSNKVQPYLNFPVGWLSGQKQRSVKPSGYALRRFESYSYQKFKPRKGLYFLGNTAVPSFSFKNDLALFLLKRKPLVKSYLK